MASQVASSTPRSSFVTTVAWIFIVLGGFATLLSILQNIMLGILLPADMPPIEPQGNGPNVPAFVRFMFDHFRLFFAAFLVLSATTLASAIGLLKRKNWARLTFIGLMSFGILWNLGGMVFTFIMFSSMPFPGGAPADFQLMSKIMTAFSVFIAIALAVLFVWIIKRLLSSDIQREFIPL